MSAVADSVWTELERDAWAPPEDLNAAEWAEKYRELSRRQSSRPGPWRNANQPAAVGVMVLASHKAVRELWLKKSAQFGASEAVRCIIARDADLDPCPILAVLPDEKTGRKIVRKRLVPLFEDTPRLRALLTGDVRDKKLTGIALSNGFELSLGWAGSPASVAADPQKKVILDEVDKYVGSALQADPIAEARVRTRTYGDTSLLVALSTPSTPLGPIAVGYDECPIKLAYYVPCPHCGQAFRPGFDRLRWEKFHDLPDARSRAARIKSRKAAWLECDACASQVPSGEPYPEAKRITEPLRRSALQAGWWATADQGWRIYTDGRFEGTKPEGERVGMHIHALIDLSVECSDVATEFVAADGRVEKLKDFYNVTLGEEFKDATSSTTANQFAAKCLPDEETGFVPGREKLIPKWASRLVMTVDTQKDYFWFVIRAWGYGLRSRRIHHGRARDFKELEDLYYHAWWRYEEDAFPARRCYGDSPLAIDSGGGMDRNEAENSITDRVYQWCLKDPTWRLPIKGASTSFEERLRWRDITYQPPGQHRTPYVVRLHLVDPSYYRDLLAGYVVGKLQVPDPATGEVVEVDQWELNDRNDGDYNAHLSAVHKVRLKKGRAFVEKWTPKSAGARHDYHDLESYQLMMATGPARCQMLPSPAQMAAQAQQSPTAAAAKPSSVRMPDGRPFFSVHRR